MANVAAKSRRASAAIAQPVVHAHVTAGKPAYGRGSSFGERRYRRASNDAGPLRRQEGRFMQGMHEMGSSPGRPRGATRRRKSTEEGEDP